MIGVNFQENIRKGEPEKYWQEHGYRFPMTVDCDDYGKALDAGNPTVIVVDKEGIVRGRWSAWTNYRAAEVELLVGSLLEQPEIEFMAARQAAWAKDYLRTLYLCEAVAAKNPKEGKYLGLEKFEALLNIDEWKALEFAKQWRKENKDNEMVLGNVGAGIAQSSALSKEVNLFGADAFEKLMKKYKITDSFVVYDLTGRCYFRAGEREKAIALAEKSLELAKQQGAAAETVRYLSGVLKKYREEQ